MNACLCNKMLPDSLNLPFSPKLNLKSSHMENKTHLQRSL